MDAEKHKGFWKSLKGLLIEENGQASPDAGEFAEEPAPLAEVPPDDLAAAMPTSGSDGLVDFGALYQAAGLSLSGKLEQALTLCRELERSLPADTPPATRQILVKTSLSAVIPLRDLVGEMERKHQVLLAYLQAAQDAARRREEEVAAEVAAYEQKIAALRAEAARKATQEAEAAAAARTAIGEIERLVELFAGAKPPTAEATAEASAAPPVAKRQGF